MSHRNGREDGPEVGPRQGWARRLGSGKRTLTPRHVQRARLKPPPLHSLGPGPGPGAWPHPEQLRGCRARGRPRRPHRASVNSWGDNMG